MKTLIVVTGPTAVGKTSLCLKIAEEFRIPIINADSRQIYKGMAIGTAAPTKEELDKVRHYFVGKLELDDYYNASMYEKEAISLLDTLFSSENEFSLLTGGSMMYIDAVCNGIDDIPTISDDTREMLKQRLEEFGLERLCKELKILDPEYYDIVDKKNTRRVVHGLEICYQTGKTYTSFRKKKNPNRPFRIIKIGLNRQRNELYDRINHRTISMINDGFIEEARGLYHLRHLNALNTVGYKELFDYFDNKVSLDEAISHIQSNTRRYARKQLTWFKRDDSVTWFHPDEISKILNHIKNQ